MELERGLEGGSGRGEGGAARGGGGAACDVSITLGVHGDGGGDGVANAEEGGVKQGVAGGAELGQEGAGEAAEAGLVGAGGGGVAAAGGARYVRVTLRHPRRCRRGWRRLPETLAM